MKLYSVDLYESQQKSMDVVPGLDTKSIDEFVERTNWTMNGALDLLSIGKTLFSLGLILDSIMNTRSVTQDVA